tara:strand:+ start:1238 stop:1900 length:663 start_codon:yes stop_codon:yes gene_type:complete
MIPHLYTMSFQEKPNQIFTVGLTGGIGAGKSTVGRVFETLGIPSFDADKYAHNIYLNDPTLRYAVIERFGAYVAITSPEGRYIDINRAKLAEVVFNSSEALNDLNKLVHPAVRRGYEDWTQSIAGSVPYAIREAAILFESGADESCDFIINVSADLELRKKRVLERDALSIDQVNSRIARQLSDEERSERADYIIFNKQKSELLKQVIEVHEKLKTVASK